MKRFLLFLLLLAGLSSCGEDQEHQECANAPDVSDIVVELDFVALDEQMRAAKDTMEMVAILKANPSIKAHFSSIPEFVDDTTRAASMMAMLAHPSYDSVLQDMDAQYGDYTSLKEELSKAFRHIKYYYPEFRVPKVRTVLSGLYNGLYVSDSLVMIAPDYFLGEEATHQPQTYDYLKKRLIKEHIVPTIVRNYSNYFNPTMVGDQTMLAEMIDFGKAYYFTKAMLPCYDDKYIIQYTAEEMAGVKANEAIIWTAFVQNEALFTTDMMLKKKFLHERPNVVEIGNEAPGRVGTWVGWEIVRSYMEHNPDVSLQSMMKITDPMIIFNGAKYKPI